MEGIFLDGYLAWSAPPRRWCWPRALRQPDASFALHACELGACPPPQMRVHLRRAPCEKTTEEVRSLMLVVAALWGQR